MVLRVSLIEVPQIEHANIVNLDWALAHMDAVKSKKTRRKTGTAEDWVYEAEMKDTGEDVGAVLHYSPKVETHAYKYRWTSRVSVPSSWTTVRATSNSRALTRIHISGVPEVIKDGVTKILENRGIKYSHRNDDILVPNTIEEQQMKKARKVRNMRCR